MPSMIPYRTWREIASTRVQREPRQDGCKRSETLESNRPFCRWSFTDTQFGASICKRLISKEISIIEKAEESLKKECRFVCELTVEENMLNGPGIVHGGYIAYLIDICSALALIAFVLARNEPWLVSTVSQSLNIVFHSPAVVGDKLRIVNVTMTMGSRAMSARTEIWNDTHHRLVASGTHIKMQPSPPKANL